MELSFNKSEFSQQLKSELIQNILPFWMRYVVDKENGGFYGAVTNDLRILNNVPRTSTLCSRILWTFSKAFTTLKKEQYLIIVQIAYEYLTKVFWDDKYGGIYWSVDNQGKVISEQKHYFAQAFAIYGLSEYYNATQESQSLNFAKEIFGLMENHGYDSENKGYFENSTRNWQLHENICLSEKDIACQKSMNTMLHILESYSNLLKVWNDDSLKLQHKNLLKLFLNNIFNSKTNQLNLYFDKQWNSLSQNISYGHSIEASWLLVEAARLQKDDSLLTKVIDTAVKISQVTISEAIDEQGGVLLGKNSNARNEKEWWVQAETVIGLFNAYQLSGDVYYANKAYHTWLFIQNNIIDRHFGDWYKILDQNSSPNPARYKAGPWECPYHQSRLCFEMMDRLRN